MIRRMLIAAAIVVFGVWVPASAENWYVGASFLDTSAEFDSAGGTFDPSSDGWKLMVGYDINKYCGIEGTYYDMGDMEDTNSVGTLDANIEAFDVSFRGMLPVGKLFRFTGKLGFSSIDIETQTTGTLLSVDVDGTSWEFMYGIGAEVDLGKRFAIRADWEAWDVEGSLDAVSIGGYFRF